MIKNDLRRQADQLVRAIEGIQGFQKLRLALPELQRVREYFAANNNEPARLAIEALMGIKPEGEQT